MGIAREHEMTRGAIVFAFNSPNYNYYDMAVFAAKRINHFLKLPVTLVTDKSSLPSVILYNWDKIITVEPDNSNARDWGIWINKGRYQAYELSPYYETLLLDVDYVVNSDKLLSIFDFYDDFCCHRATSYLLNPGLPQELLSSYSYETLWATIILFKKTKRVEYIFKTLEMIQKNYMHYANIHSFIGNIYRNDYALTLALKIVNGHDDIARDYIPWNLLHIGKNTVIEKTNSSTLDTTFVAKQHSLVRGKTRLDYIIVKDLDFHMMNKDMYIEMINSSKSK